MTKKRNEEKNFYATTKEVGEFFGFSVRTIQNWDCPKIEKNLYNLKAVFDWWNENINKPVSDADKSARERLSLAKAKIAELDLAEREGNLLSRKEVVESWTARIVELRNSLESLAYWLPTKIAKKPVEFIEKVLKETVKKMLRTYHREGRFTPLVEEKKKPEPKKKTARKPRKVSAVTKKGKK